MSVNFTVPSSARFISPAVSFTAAFNTPTVGKYDFGIAANALKTVFELQANTVYLISQMSIGGTVASEDFLESISVIPKLRFFRKVMAEGLYTEPIPITQFNASKEVSIWVISQKAGDSLQATLTGILSQTSAFVGLASITLNVSLSVYAIDEKEYNKNFRDSLLPSFSRSIRG